MLFFFFKQKTAYEMRISDWSSDVCSSDLLVVPARHHAMAAVPHRLADRPRVSPIKPDRIGQIGRAQRPVPLARRPMANRAIVGKDPVQIGRASCRERVCQYV